MKKLEEEYEKIHPKIYTFFYAKTGNQATAQDLCHDTFYEACKNIASFNGHSTLSTWVFSIANNLLKKYYRKNKYQQSLMQKLASLPDNETHSLEEMAEINEETKILLHHISKLDDASREIILLRIYGELSFAEIGILIGKSENYTRVTFHRLKLKIQKLMEETL
ncbi:MULTISPECIES: RNA polymerase sigma factor [Bacillaceae]|uniref:RNA polymerase sigma factor n=1 Tax=Psychrobacillus lasiicapitis TaxID=1636719 RepID=A0A544SWC6_9BACI|nr:MULTISPECIES: RNA polymerase sigma factor [Bacillaceae]QEY20797.1 RNA polymerase sigma factor [Psychrobacillus sp. AK 1817]TQR09509.1 RNA polymerase sigma factor [Psychrobacillus lasiicapitis]GGA49765.1 DNA-directed RNA polymerase sigma-70 factor [Psychrobacillus lasiicapitis]